VLAFLFQGKLAAARGALVLRKSALFETHALVPWILLASGATRCCCEKEETPCEGDSLLQLFVKAQMRIGHQRGDDRLRICVTDFRPDPLTDRIDALRRIHACFCDSARDSFGKC